MTKRMATRVSERRLRDIQNARRDINHDFIPPTFAEALGWFVLLMIVLELMRTFLEQ